MPFFIAIGVQRVPEEVKILASLVRRVMDPFIR